jgi:hypothetical protein
MLKNEEQSGSKNNYDLLKQLKLTFESFIFYGSQSKNWNNFTGLVNIFAKNIYSIIQDEFEIKSFTSSLPVEVGSAEKASDEINNNELNYQLITQLWSFINETFVKITTIDDKKEADQDHVDATSIRNEFLFVKNQMKTIRKQIYFLNDNENPVFEWIFISLQTCNLHKQLQFLFNQSYLDCFYKKNSFVLDQYLLGAFLSYISAYERRDCFHMGEWACEKHQ